MSEHFEYLVREDVIEDIRKRLIADSEEADRVAEIVRALEEDPSLIEYEEAEEDSEWDVDDYGRPYKIVGYTYDAYICMPLPRNKCIICHYEGLATLIEDDDGYCDCEDVCTLECVNYYYGIDEE